MKLKGWIGFGKQSWECLKLLEVRYLSEDWGYLMMLVIVSLKDVRVEKISPYVEWLIEVFGHQVMKWEQRDYVR